MEAVKTTETLTGIIQKETGVLVYFYNDDCAPCMSLRPKVEDLVLKQFPKLKLLWVDSKASPEVPASFGVFANPTLLLFFEGKEFRRYSKYVSVDELSSTIERYYDMIFEGPS